MEIQEDHIQNQIDAQININNNINKSQKDVNFNLNSLKTQKKVEELTSPDKQIMLENIIWNTFLEKESEEFYRKQFKNYLDSQLSCFLKTNNLFTRQNISMLVNLQLNIENKHFQLVPPSLRLRLICVIFFKYVNISNLKRLFEGFFEEIDLANRKKLKKALYK